MINIHEVMTELAKMRPIFHSEADFQFALAWQIREMMPETRFGWSSISTPFIRKGCT